ncbi:MAG: YaiO family outer membrane beta-barrel protein [Chitinophagales bacterium]
MSRIHPIIKMQFLTFCILKLLLFNDLQAQVDIDTLFEKAKITAYAKEYTEAIEQLQNILEIQNHHFDAQLMLSRVLAWNKQYEKSLEQIEELLVKYPDNEDVLQFKETVEKWRESDKQSNFNEHIQLSNNTDFLLSNQTKWQFASLEYYRNIPDMPLSARLNYSNRFDLKGTQFEVEIYPKFSNRNYVFLSLAYSESVLFANYTLAASLFHNVKNDLELEGGFRYILFDSNTPILAGVLSIGKYTHSIWANYRFSLIKAGRFNGQTHRFRFRRYLQDEHNYIFMDATVGTTERDIQAFEALDALRTNTKNINIGVKKGLSNRLYATIAVGYELTTNGEQRKTSILSTNVALTHRF